MPTATFQILRGDARMENLRIILIEISEGMVVLDAVLLDTGKTCKRSCCALEL